MALEDATSRRFEDSKGKSRPYSKSDLNYDIDKGWLRVGIETADGKVLQSDGAAMMTVCNRWGHHHLACLVKSLGRTDTKHDGLSSMLSAHAYMAMKDMKWRDYVDGPDREAILAAYNTKTSWSVLAFPRFPSYPFYFWEEKL